MKGKLTFNKAVLGLLILIIIISVLKISGGGISGYISGYVFGVPGSCVSKISVTGPSVEAIYPGETKSLEVQVFNVSCGVSYVRLSLDALPDDWYAVSPISITNIAPGQNKSFTVYIDIPLDAELKTYSTNYQIYTNEGPFTLGELELNVVAPEKPKTLPAQISTGSAESEGAGSGITSENKKFWLSVAIVASILAIALLATEYFHYTEETEEAVKERAGAELPKVLGKTPREKKSFETVLKKPKKKK